jgi:hypothetical protein
MASSYNLYKKTGIFLAYALFYMYARRKIADGAFAMPSFRISDCILNVFEPVDEVELAREVLNIVL